MPAAGKSAPLFVIAALAVALGVPRVQPLVAAVPPPPSNGIPGHVRSGIAAANATTRFVEQGPRGHVLLPDFRLGTDAAGDDSQALARALATGRKVYLPEGKGSGADGVYVFEQGVGTTPAQLFGNLVSGAHVFGDGMGRTRVRRSAAGSEYIFVVNSLSADPAKNVAGITFKDMTLEDDCETRGFLESAHLVALGGVSDALFERVEFKGFRGDGLYIGSSLFAGTERHNERVTVRGCRFDGVNKNNRNAITVIDCDGLTVEGCEFKNCTRPGDGTANTPGDRPLDPSYGLGMPGPIDVEPDAHPFHRVRAVLIRDCHFRDNGGGAVSLLVAQQRIATLSYEQFVVRGNTFEACTTAFNFAGQPDAEPKAATKRFGVRFEDNLIRNCPQPARLSGVFGMTFAGNRWEDCGPIHFGLDAGDANRELRFDGDTFTACGDTGQVFVQDSDLVDVAIERCKFVDCGKADGTQGWIYFLRGNADCDRLRIVGNTVESPAGRTTAFLQVVGGYTGAIDRSTCEERDNEVPAAIQSAGNLVLGPGGGR